MTKDQLVRQVVQGGGNMPAYGKNLSPYEVEAVVSYMASLRPKGQPPARDSTFPGVPPSKRRPPRTRNTAKVEPELLVVPISLHICVPAVM